MDFVLVLGVDQEEFSEIEKCFESSFTLKAILSNIYKMANKLCFHIAGTLQEKAKNSVNVSKLSVKSNNTEKEQDNYEELERMLQKYEQEVREHIRIEQQLKLYADGLEEEVDQLKEKLKDSRDPEEFKEIIFKKDSEIERLKNKLGIYEENLKKRMKSGRYQSIPYYKKSNKSVDKVT